MGRKGFVTRDPGPYGTWEEDDEGCLRPILTEEGQRILVAWLKDWPEPSKLYRSLARREYEWARKECCIDVEEMDAAAKYGITNAMWSWDPERADFATIACHHIRAAIGRLTSMRDSRKQIHYGISVISGNKPLKHKNDDERYDLLGLMGEWDDDQSGRVELRTEMQAAINKRVPSPRDREMFNMYYGFLDDTPKTLEEVGRHYNLTRERIRQILLRTLDRIGPDLLRMHRKYVQIA